MSTFFWPLYYILCLNLCSASILIYVTLISKVYFVLVFHVSQKLFITTIVNVSSEWFGSINLCVRKCWHVLEANVSSHVVTMKLLKNWSVSHVNTRLWDCRWVLTIDWVFIVKFYVMFVRFYEVEVLAFEDQAQQR